MSQASLIFIRPIKGKYAMTCGFVLMTIICFAQSEEYEGLQCALTESQWYNTKEMKKRVKRIKQRLKKIDKPFARAYAKAPAFNEEKLREIMLKGNGIDLSKAEHKHLLNLLKEFDFSIASGDDADESRMIFEELKNQYKDTLNVYWKPLSYATQITIYGIHKTEEMERICCLLKQISAPYKRKVWVWFYEKENFETISESDNITIGGRGEEKLIVKLFIQ